MLKYIVIILINFVIIPTVYSLEGSLPGGPELVADGGVLSKEPLTIEDDTSN